MKESSVLMEKSLKWKLKEMIVDCRFVVSCLSNNKRELRLQLQFAMSSHVSCYPLLHRWCQSMWPDRTWHRWVWMLLEHWDTHRMQVLLVRSFGMENINWWWYGDAQFKYQKLSKSLWPQALSPLDRSIEFEFEFEFVFWNYRYPNRT